MKAYILRFPEGDSVSKYVSEKTFKTENHSYQTNTHFCGYVFEVTNKNLIVVSEHYPSGSSMRSLNEGGRWPRNIVVGLLFDYDVIITFWNLLKILN